MFSMWKTDALGKGQYSKKIYRAFMEMQMHSKRDDNKYRVI